MPRPGFLPALRRQVRGAGRNLAGILHSRPQIVHLLLSLWPLAWGENALASGDALWATAPSVYAWMHSGPLSPLSARAWGAGMLLLGAWQIAALVWPSPRRDARMRRAARALCGCNSGMALGFLLATPGSPSWRLYALFAAASVWCLWRLAEGRPPAPGRDDAADAAGRSDAPGLTALNV